MVGDFGSLPGKKCGRVQGTSTRTTSKYAFDTGTDRWLVTSCYEKVTLVMHRLELNNRQVLQDVRDLVLTVAFKR